MLDTVGSLIVVCDADGRIVLFNHACEELTGYGEPEVLGADAVDLLIPLDEHAGVRAMLRRLLDGEAPIAHRNHWRVREGPPRLIEWRNAALTDDAGVVTHVVGTGIDVTAQAAAEHAREVAQLELTRLSLEDPLTGLPNRTLAHAYLAELLAEEQPVSVLCFGLDRLNRINDSLGTELADQLVCAVVDRVSGNLAAGERLARSRGDEFLLIGPGPAPDLLQRIESALAEPFNVEAHRLAIMATIGLASAPEAGITADDLIRASESAMHAAKREQVPALRFDERMHAEETARFQREVQLRHALDSGRGLTLWFQPLVRTSDGVVIGAEALLRWVRADGSMLLPHEFLQEVRTAGLAGRLARLTIDLSFAAAARWRAQLGADRPFRVALNLTPRQILDVDVVDYLRQSVEKGDVDPRSIVVELTEDAFEDVPERTLAVLAELHAAGLSIAVDDFGTGYSALDRLHRMRVDVLKIDKSFATAIDRDPRSYTLVKAITDASHTLGAAVVAEGVETAAQFKALRDINVDAVQGFLFGEAAPEDALDLSDRRLP